MKLEYFQKDAAGNIVMGLHERFQKQFHHIIGIDPDIEANGFALYDCVYRGLKECKSLPFFELFTRLEDVSKYSPNPKGMIEGGWLLDKSSWHNKQYFDQLNSATAAAGTRGGIEALRGLVSSKVIATRENIAKKVGMNHAVGRLIVEMFIHLGIPFQVVPPRKPIFEDEKFFKKVTGWKERTNKDARSAANYCFGY